MSPNSIEKIKQAQSSLKLERKPVSHVQEAVKESKEITQFVKTALSNENRWIFQTGEQESIVLMLNEINKTSKELYEKCRSPEHFNREISSFLKMKNEIFRKSNCIHFSLDQGFYNTEPLGFSPRSAVDLSSKKIQSIREGLDKGTWVQSPIRTKVEELAKKEFENFYSEMTQLKEKIFDNENFKSFDPPLSIKEIQILYKYFQNVNSILNLEKEAIKSALKKKSDSDTLSIESILDKLSDFEKTIKNVKINPSNTLPDWSTELSNISNTDLQLRMYLLRIPFEPNVFQKKLNDEIKRQKELLGIEKSIIDFHKNLTEKLGQIELFVDIFGEIYKTFMEVTGILQNLSISFGKIYRNASSKNITKEFLIKVLMLILDMLEKGGEVAKSKTKKLDELQQKVKEVELFDKSIIKGIFYAIELLDEGKIEIEQFCEEIKSFKSTISEKSNWESMEIYIFLKKAYEKSTTLTSAAMIFGSVTKTSILLKESINNVGSIMQKLTKLNENDIEKESLYKKTIVFLENDIEMPNESIKKSKEKIEELNWLLEEMLGKNINEEVRFVEEIKKELQPVFSRIEKRRLKDSTKKLENKGKDDKIKHKTSHKKASQNKISHSSKHSQKTIISKKNVYDPFEPFEMVAIKEACKNMTSSEGKMIYHVLTNTHTFFTLLNKMENTFKPGEGLENELIQDIEKSKTTHEFLNNFARLKFLPHGYFNNNNAKFEYNKEKRRFVIPSGIEKQLKLSETSIGTPMEVYRRLIRVVLGFDDPKTLSTIMPQQVLSILEEDFSLKAKDRRLVEEKLQST